LRLKGLAEAEAMAAKAQSWSTYNEAAITDRVLGVLPEIAAAVSAPLAKTERIVMIGGGNGSGPGAARITKDVTQIVAELRAVIDPFHEHKTLSITCNVIDPITRELYTRDPRYIAQKAERYLVETGIADTCWMGPEAEFYIFDHVAFDQRPNTAFYEVES